MVSTPDSVPAPSRSAGRIANVATLASWSASAAAVVTAARLITDHLKLYELELLFFFWAQWIVIIATVILAVSFASVMAFRHTVSFSRALSLVGRLVWINTVAIMLLGILRQSWLDPGWIGVTGALLVLNAVCAFTIFRISRRDAPEVNEAKSTAFENWAAVLLHAANLLCLFLLIFHTDLLVSWPMRLAMIMCVIALIAMRVVFSKRERMLNTLTLVLFALIASGGVIAWMSTEIGLKEFADSGESNAPKKIILITVDTLRAEMLRDATESGEALMPHVMGLARDGVQFTKATGPSSWTLPAIASMMTGLDPMTHGVTRSNKTMSLAMETLAERLSDAGYLTGAFVYNFYIHPELHADQGFRDFYFCDPKKVQMEMQSLLHQADLRRAKFEFGNDSVRESTAMARRWLERRADERTFLWIHYIDPHMPYEPPPDFAPEGYEDRPASFELRPSEWPKAWRYTEEDREWVRALYRGEVRYVDHCIGEIIQTLKVTGQYEDSLIIFTSDHGEEHWDHGRFEHAHAMYQELMHVPLVIKPPRSEWKGTRDARIAVPRIYPTILDFADADYSDLELDYTSLMPFVRNEIISLGDKNIFANSTLYFDELRAVIENEMKLIENVNDASYALYDLQGDPEETRDLSAEKPEERDRLAALLAEHVENGKAKMDRLGIQPAPAGAKMSDEVLRGLDDLGYLR